MEPSASQSRDHSTLNKDAGYGTAAIARAQNLLEQMPERIGAYRILERIGGGGMGEVYVAEQTAPIKRRVALKVIKAGMDTRQVVARFEAERQALAMMDHPNIARVFDAGATDTGRPYFVMELVRGIPITKFADDNKLTTRQRVELLVPICQAVQHAHQKGIIHRDIKPHNVLVTLHDGVPVPKVIDFGIAKATTQPLTDKTVYTELRAMIGTPAYMSPEQAEMSGLDIDTRSDIYSLGVLAYELLTGSPPFDSERLVKAGIGEIQRIIREEDPPRPSIRLSTIGDRLTTIAKSRDVEPSKLSKLLAGELDWIVMRAMEKDRRRRYDTATDLAADFNRHLNGEPVIAAPPTLAYRMQKFSKKYRRGIIVTSIFFFLLLVGMVGTGTEFFKERTARIRADGAERKAVFAGKIATERGDILQQQAMELARQSYRYGLSAAVQAMNAGELANALEILKGLPEKNRGWEWRYLWSECDSTLSEVRLPERTKTIAKTDDGAYTLLKDDTGNGLLVIRAIDGSSLDRIMLPPVESILGAALSESGRQIAVLAANQSDQSRDVASTLYVWDSTTHQIILSERSSLKSTGYVFTNGNGISISENGARVAVCDWDFSQGPMGAVDATSRIPYRFNSWGGGFVFDLLNKGRRYVVKGGTSMGRLSLNGRYLLSSQNAVAHVIDLENIEATKGDNFSWNFNAKNVLTNDPNVIIVLPSEPGSSLSRFNLTSRKLLGPIRDFGKTDALFIGRSGKCAVGIVDGFLNVYPQGSAQSPVPLCRIPSDGQDFYLDEESRSIFAYSGDKIIRFPLPTDTQLTNLAKVPSAVEAIAEDGSSFLFKEAGLQVSRDPKSFAVLQTFGGDFVYSGHVYDRSNLRGGKYGAPSFESLNPKKKGEWFMVEGFRSNPRIGRLAVSVSGGNLEYTWHKFCILDNANSLVNTITPGQDEPQLLAYVDDNLWVLMDQQIDCYSAQTGKRVHLGMQLSADAAAVSRDGNFLAVASGDVAKIVDLRSFTLVRDWHIPHRAYDLSWGSDDHRLYISGTKSTTICDPNTGDVLVTLPSVWDWGRYVSDGGPSILIPRSGDAALFGNHITTCLPLREWWPAFEAEDAEENDPQLIAEAQARVNALLSEQGKFEELHGEVLGDAKYAPLKNLLALQAINQIKAAAQNEFTRLCRLYSTRAAFLAALSTDPALIAKPRLLEEITELVEKYDQGTANAMAWDIASKPGHRVEEYQAALHEAEYAVNLAPDDAGIINTLGVAQYRAGQYDNALKTLARSESMLQAAKSQPLGEDWAVMAMADYRLGKLAEARHALSVALSIKDGSGLCDEASALIDPSATQPTTRPANP